MAPGRLESSSRGEAWAEWKSWPELPHPPAGPRRRPGGIAWAGPPADRGGCSPWRCRARGCGGAERVVGGEVDALVLARRSGSAERRLFLARQLRWNANSPAVQDAEVGSAPVTIGAAGERAGIEVDSHAMTSRARSITTSMAAAWIAPEGAYRRLTRRHPAPYSEPTLPWAAGTERWTP